MVRQTKVVIGTEVEHTLTIGIDFHVLGAGDDSFNLVSACLPHDVELGLAHSFQV